METKSAVLNKIDTEYLQSVAISICNIPRYNYALEEKDKVIKALNSKLTKEQAKKIYRFFIMNYTSEETAKIIREPNGKEILFRLIENNNPFNTDDIFISEVLIQGKRCDLVHIKKDYSILNAVEIKANGDKLDNLINQCNLYSKWADKVWVLLGQKHISKKDKINELKKLGMGIMVFSSTNEIALIKKPKKNMLKKDLLKHLPVSHIKNIARRYNLSTNKNKSELIYQINSNLNSNVILKEFRKEMSCFISR